MAATSGVVAAIEAMRPSFASALLASALTLLAAPGPRAAEPPAEPAPLPASLDPTPAPAAPAPPAPSASPQPRTFREPVVPREQTRAVVLLYHLFGEVDSPMNVPADRFEAQLKWLHDNRIEVVSATDLTRFLDGSLELPERVAVITIDDGHRSVRRVAFPILRRYGASFTLALNTAAIEGRRPEAVTWDEVRDMMASGLCDLASHSHTHGHLARFTEASSRKEVTLSRAILEQRTGVRPETFVFPFGERSAKTMRIVEQAGYRAAFAVAPRPVTTGSPRFELPRQEVARSTTLAAFARFFEG